MNKNLYDVLQESTLGPYQLYLVKAKDLQRRAHEVFVFDTNQEIKIDTVPHFHQHSLSKEDAELIIKTIRRTIKFVYAKEQTAHLEDIEA